MEKPKFNLVKSLMAKSSYIVAFVLFILLITPSNAFAHGIGGATSSDSNARVIKIVPNNKEFSARTVENGQRLEITRKSKNDLFVLGVDGEQYLKFSEEGVFQNEKSATAVINKSTNNSSNSTNYGDEFKKTSSDPDAKPVWKKVSSQQSYIFHDHRAHYMGNTPDRAGNLGSNIVPIRIGTRDYDIEVSYFTKNSPNAFVWFGLLFFSALLIILLLVKTKLLQIISSKKYLFALLSVLFILELIHVIGYIKFVHINFLSSLSQSLYGLILLVLIIFSATKILATNSSEFIYKSAPWLCIVGLFGLIVDTLGEYQFFTARYLPTVFPTFYSRVSLILIGLISTTVLYIGIKNIKDKQEQI